MRARIESVDNETVTVYFVDFGDFHETTISNTRPIPDHLVSRLPFQAIECRLVGVEDDAATDEVLDHIYSFSDEGATKLRAVVVRSSKAELSGGKKHHVHLFSLSGVSLNRCLLDTKLVSPVQDELELLLDNHNVLVSDVDENDDDDDGDEWEEKEEEEEEKQQEQENKEISAKDVNCNDSSPSESNRFDADALIRLLQEESTNEDFPEFLKNVFQTNKELKITELDPRENSTNFKDDLSKENNQIKKEHYASKEETLHHSSIKTQQKEVNEDLMPSLLMSEDPSFKTPRVKWLDLHGYIRVRVEVTDACAEQCYVLFTNNTLTFQAAINENKYNIFIRLVGCIKPEVSFFEVKTHYVQLCLVKSVHLTWPRLQCDVKQPWFIVRDLDQLEEVEDDLADSALREALARIDAGQLLKAKTLDPDQWPTKPADFSNSDSSEFEDEDEDMEQEDNEDDDVKPEA